MPRWRVNTLFLVALLGVMALPACARRAHEAPLADAQAAPVKDVQRQSASADATISALLASLPDPPASTPSPWVKFEVERALDAQCEVGKSHAALRPDAAWFSAECKGRMPRHLADVLMALPSSLLFASRKTRAGWIDDEVELQAIAGKGLRPDFYVSHNKFAIRSFEGPAEVDTVYWIDGPIRCNTSGSRSTHYPAVAECQDPLRYTLLVKRGADGGLVEATTDVGFTTPDVSAADLNLIKLHTGGGAGPIGDRLHLSPVIRWTADVDPDDPIPRSHPRSIRYGTELHYGFDVWDGRRFVRHQTVAEALWPCTHPFDLAECSDDRFVTKTGQKTPRTRSK